MSYINIILVLIEVIGLFFTIYFTYKKYSINGLYFLILIFTFVSNIFMLKRFEIFTLKLNAGIVLNLMIYIISNVIVQKKGPYAISDVVLIIFISSLFSYVILSLSGLMPASEYNEHFNMLYNNVFEYNIRAYFASLSAYLISLTLGSKLYYALKREKNKVWISNLLTIVINQIIESIIFITIMYMFSLKLDEVIFMILCRYIFKILIGVFSNILQTSIAKLD